MRRLGTCLLLVTVAVGTAIAGAATFPANVPEPRGYWLGPIHGPVPTTIAGGKVIGTAVLARLQASRDVLLVDVADAAQRPAGLPAGTLWLPPPHRDIPGSVWIPDVGHGAISPRFAVWFRTRLAALTGGNRDKRIVVYCHPSCWMSWNAAKRMINDGYRAVSWYPDGLEGWVKAGHPTAAAKPQQPDAR